MKNKGKAFWALVALSALVSAGGLGVGASSGSDEEDTYWTDRQAVESLVPMSASVAQALPVGYKMPDPCGQTADLLLADWLEPGHYPVLVVPESTLYIAPEGTSFGTAIVHGGLLGVSTLIFSGNLLVDPGAIVATADGDDASQPAVLGLPPKSEGAGSIVIQGTPFVHGTLVAGNGVTPPPSIHGRSGDFPDSLTFTGEDGGYGGSIILEGDKAKHTVPGSGLDGACIQTGAGSPGGVPCYDPLLYSEATVTAEPGDGGGGGTLYAPLNLIGGTTGSWADVFTGSRIIIGNGGDGGSALVNVVGPAQVIAKGGQGGTSGWIRTPGSTTAVGDVFPNVANTPRGGNGGDAEPGHGYGLNAREACEDELESLWNTNVALYCPDAIEVSPAPDGSVPLASFCAFPGLPGVSEIAGLAGTVLGMVGEVEQWALGQFAAEFCGVGAGVIGGSVSLTFSPEQEALVAGRCGPSVCAEALASVGCLCLPSPGLGVPTDPDALQSYAGATVEEIQSAPACGPNHTGTYSMTTGAPSAPSLAASYAEYLTWLYQNGVSCALSQATADGSACTGAAGTDAVDVCSTPQDPSPPQDPEPAKPKPEPPQPKYSMSGTNERVALDDATDGLAGGSGTPPTSLNTREADAGPGGDGFFKGGRGGNGTAKGCDGLVGDAGQDGQDGADSEWVPHNKYCETVTFTMTDSVDIWSSEGSLVELSDEFQASVANKYGGKLAAWQEANANATADVDVKAGLYQEAFSETQNEVTVGHATTTQRTHQEGGTTTTGTTVTRRWVTCDADIAVHSSGGSGGHGGNGAAGQDGADAIASGGDGGAGLLIGGEGGTATATGGKGGDGGINGRGGAPGSGCSRDPEEPDGERDAAVGGDNGEVGANGTGGSATASKGIGGDMWSSSTTIWPLYALPPLGKAPDGNETGLPGDRGEKREQLTSPWAGVNGPENCPPAFYDPQYRNGHGA